MKEKPKEQSSQQNPQFMIQRLYIKDISFEAPNTPNIFKEKWEPNLDLDLNIQSHTLEEKDIYEVVLTITATVKNNNTLAYLIEIKQAGIFTIQGTPTEQLGHILNSFCPTILFPYARETISYHVLHASFPPLILSPINFDALYMQKQAETKKT